jgi:Uma2 family endonuclease
MSQIIQRPPRTIMEVYKMLPEGTLAELIDGVIYMSPSPNSSHQRIILSLGRKLADFAEQQNLGEVFVAPFDVYLDDKSNAVQPDLIFILESNRHIVQDHIHGVPDLLIELLSTGNKLHDTVVKKALYEKFGVKEYWIIEPVTKEATGYILVNSKYVELPKLIGEIHIQILNHKIAF